MNKYPIHITHDITLEKLKQGLFIFIYRATKIPPHLGIITNGKLFDISSVGPNLGIDITDFYNTVLKRKTEVVFIELIKPNSNIELEVLAKNCVTLYWKVTKEVSCLSPIKDFLVDAYQLNTVKEANFIFELLPILEDEKLVKEKTQMNTSKKLKNNNLHIIRYTKKDVENCLDALNRKQQLA